MGPCGFERLSKPDSTRFLGVQLKQNTTIMTHARRRPPHASFQSQCCFLSLTLHSVSSCCSFKSKSCYFKRRCLGTLKGPILYHFKICIFHPGLQQPKNSLYFQKTACLAHYSQLHTKNDQVLLPAKPDALLDFPHVLFTRAILVRENKKRQPRRGNEHLAWGVCYCPG